MTRKILINFLCTESRLCEHIHESPELSDSAYYFQKANSYEDFIQTTNKIDSQIAVIDYSSAGFDTHELKQLLETTNTSIPVILLIDEKDEEIANRFMLYGLFDYVFKSNTNKLKLSIQNAIITYHADKTENNVLKDVIANVPGCVYQFYRSPTGIFRLLFASEFFSELFAISIEETRKDFQRSLTKINIINLHDFFQSIEESAKHLSKWTHEFAIQLEDGSKKWIKGSASPKQFENGEIIWSGVLLDVSKEHINDSFQLNNITTQQQQLKAIIDSTVEAIISIDDEGLIHTCNPATSRIFGYYESELIGKNISVLMPEPDRSHHDKYMKNYSQTGVAKVLGKGRNIRCMTKDGHIFPAYLGVSKYYIGNQLMFVGLIQDMTEITDTVEALKKSEHTLKKQNQLLELTHNSLTDYINKRHIKKSSKSLLAGLIELTDSKFGFTSEILKSENGDPFIKLNATAGPANMTNPFDRLVEPKKLSTKEQTFYRDTYLTGKVIMLNDYIDKDGIIENYLGVPVYDGKHIVGMYGLANRPDGYNEEILKLLEPFNKAYSVIIHSTRLENIQDKIKRDLLIAKDNADSANLAKSQFLAKMSHELRTPLNAIIGYAQLMELDSRHLTVSDKDNVAEITSAGKHLLSLINDILDLSKIESGKVNLTIDSYELNKILEDCVNLSQRIAQPKNVKISIRGDITQTIKSDITRLKQVILNLLSNAIKYNKDNGTVNINVVTTGQDIRIEITDSGYGIPDSHKDKIFTAFNRLNFENSEIIGTGIGLVITKQLVNLLHGEIGFKSKENIGSSFWISIPINYDLAREKREVQESQITVSNSTRRKVLYIEDNMANLNMAQQILELFENVDFYAADTPEKGIALANEILPDLILLDINLPNIDGFQVLSILQNQEETKNIQVIGVSANSFPSDIEKAEESGFDDYITKPINLQVFIQKVGNALKLN